MGKIQYLFAYIASIFKLDRSILIFVFSWSMIGLAHFGLIGVLGNLYILSLGFDFHYIGILNGSSQIIWALFALPAGLIGRRFGLRNSVVAAYVVVIVGLVAFLSAAWFPQRLWGPILFLGNGLVGVAAALVSVNGVPYLMAISPDEDRNKAFTLQTALFALTSFLGSLLAGILPGFFMKWFPGLAGESQAFNAVLWLTVPVYLVTVYVMRTARVEPAIILPRGEGKREKAPVAMLLFLGILVSVQLSSENAVNFFMNVYFAEDLLQSAAFIGTLFAVARLLPFFVSPLQPIILARWGSGMTMAVFCLLIGAVSMMLSLVPTVAVAVTVFILFNVFSSFTTTARNLFGQESVQPQWRTVSSAVISISTGFSGGFIGMSAGPIIEAAGFRGLFMVGAGLSVLAVVLLSGHRYINYRKQAEAQPEVVPAHNPIE